MNNRLAKLKMIIKEKIVALCTEIMLNHFDIQYVFFICLDLVVIVISNMNSIMNHF